MKHALSPLMAAGLLALSSCIAPGAGIEPVAPMPVAEAPAAALWNFASAADAIRAASCDASGAPMRGLLPLEMQVSPLTANQAEAISQRLPEGGTLAGAWELTSPDPNFGGLSGLALEDETTLLAVTDAGGWVKLGLDAGAPSAAAIGYMRGPDGQFLSGKGESDAEGLSVRDGIAFVSFERDFRIAAFDTGTCGAGAKAVEIAALPGSFDGDAIETNEGPEAVLLTPGGELQFGYEGASGNPSPLGQVLAGGKAGWTGEQAAKPSGFALVSMDSVRLRDGTDRGIFLYRAFDPIRGPRSVLVWGPGEEGRLTLSRPVLTDNFEGLAAQVLETGQLRLWILSDNNFSDLQRTLIYAFDVPL